MFREALRRILWLGPTLLVVTLPTFWALARAEGRLGATSNGLPLFFNADPEGAREHALAAARRVARGGPDGVSAAAELARLGGAAIPHVLSTFDALDPGARGRVALALLPIVARMGVGAPEFESDETAALFLGRYWREHSVDFRPAVVHREVERFSAHPSPLRLAEVTSLDTFALEALIDGMRPLRTQNDVARVRHLAAVAAHVTGDPWTIPEGASLDGARGAVERWESFWLEHRSDYVALTGPRRLGATLTETRYGQWLARLFLRLRHRLDGDRTVGTTFAARGATTLALVFWAFAAGYPLALVASIIPSWRRRLSATVFAVAACVASLGIVGVSGLLARFLGPRHGTECAAAAMIAVGAALALHRYRALTRRTAELPHIRTALAFGASPLRVSLVNLRLVFGAALALAVADLPGVITASFVVERVFSLKGLGQTVVEAARSGDHTSLMTLALIGTLTLGLAQIASDLLLGVADPRVRGVRRTEGVRT